MKVRNVGGLIGVILLISLVCSCASDPGFISYRQGMFQGTEALRSGQYQIALEQLLRASQGEPDKPMPLALAGHAAYMLGDYGKASQYLAQAAKLDPDQSKMEYVIVLGYQSLIAFREGRREDGMTALKDYLRYYRDSYPDNTMENVELMYKTGDISVPELESLINHQMDRYEKELFQFF